MPPSILIEIMILRVFPNLMSLWFYEIEQNVQVKV